MGIDRKGSVVLLVDVVDENEYQCDECAGVFPRWEVHLEDDGDFCSSCFSWEVVR